MINLESRKLLDNKDDKADDKSKQDKKVKISEDNRMRYLLNNKRKEMETDFDVNEHIVIDLGNAITKVGFSGEDLPTYVMPSIHGRSIYADMEKKNEITYELKTNLFGYEALDSKENYRIKNLSAGDHKTATDLEFGEMIRELMETKLSIIPSDYKVIVNISPIKNQDNIVTLGRIFLEDLGFKGLAMINSSSLSLFSTGRTSGIVIECGERRTYTVPIYEGFPLYHALNKNKIGGRDVTDIIAKGTGELGVLPDDIQNLRSIKEKMCCVPYLEDISYYINNDQDIITNDKMLYKLPDDNIIEIPKRCRLLAGEVLFK